MCQRIIFPKNGTADAINNFVMKLIPGDADTFVSADSVDDSIYTTEQLNTLI